MTWENRFTFEISSAAPDATPVWVDFTTRIRDSIQPMDLRIGRQTNLDQTEPSVLTLLLDNDDDALTYGNTSSPYPWWAPGQRCRLRETIAGVTLDLFTGFTQAPEETITTAGIDQKVSLTAVDRLGAMQGGRPFASTLAAHIVGSARNGALKQYWTLLDAGQPFQNQVAGGQVLTFYQPPGAVGGVLTPQGGAAPPGDDASPLLAVPAYSGVNPTTSSGLIVPDRVTPLAVVSAGQIMTVVGWFKLNLSTDALISLLDIQMAGTFDLRRQATSSGGTFRLTSPVGTLTGSVNSTMVVGADVYYILAMRVGFTPNVLELWVNDQTYVGALVGAPVGNQGAFTFFTLPAGSAEHLQIYVGDPSDFTAADFLAQRQVGLYGLERQTTGERIRTIARYAGIPNAEIANTIDTGTSVMQRARLAGKTPLAAMREAETTEQGSLYVDGSGNLCFADRRTIYNI